MLSVLLYTPSMNGPHDVPAWAGGIILLALLLAGLVAALGRDGLELSPDNQCYRYCFELLGLRLGRWQPLPPVVGLTLKFFSEVSRGNAGTGVNSWGIWDTGGVRYQKLVLLLSLQGSHEGLVVGEYGPDALAAARQAAEALAARFGGVPVREYLVPQRTGRR